MNTIVKTKHNSSRQEIYDWLNEQAKQLGIDAALLTHRANMSDGRLYLLVRIGNAADAYDEASKLQELESSWNYQEPAPNPRVFLLPAEESDMPGWTEAYTPVQQAIDRYYEAFDTFRAATSADEAQKALKEMEAAKEAELAASRQLSQHL